MTSRIEIVAALWHDMDIYGMACFRRLPDGGVERVDPTTVRLAGGEGYVRDLRKGILLAKQETTEGTDLAPGDQRVIALLQQYPGLPVVIKGMACPVCNHLCHPHACTVRLPWWRRLLTRLEFCCCTYWDARWGDR